MDSIFKLIAEITAESGQSGVSFKITPILNGLWNASIIDLSDKASSVMLDRFGDVILSYTSVKPEYAIEGLNKLCSKGE